MTTQTVTVPASIDATGASDVGPALNNWLAGVPNGSIVSFPAGATYKMSVGLHMGQRSNLVFEGNGTTLLSTMTANDRTGSNFMLGKVYGDGWPLYNTDILIRDFNLVGSSPTPGVYNSAVEAVMGVSLAGSQRVEVTGCTFSAIYGDAVFCAEDMSDVWVHDNHVVTTGRIAATVVNGTNVTFERNTIDRAGYVIFDVEPDVVTQHATNIIFRNNTVGSSPEFFAAGGSNNAAPLHGITVTGNTATGMSLNSQVDNGGAARILDIVFTDNTSSTAYPGPVLRFAHVDGLTVTGNHQPLSSGVLVSQSDCTAVTISGNT